MIRGLASLAVAAALATASAPASANPRVVVSILPLHSLVAAVMDGVGEPVLLLEPALSPHNYALRPSDAAALSSADVVFWIGPGMEAFLVRALAALSSESRVVAAVAVPGVTILPLRGSEVGRDLHLWLDPGNARAIVAHAALVLAEIDPGNAARYSRNRDAAIAGLDALEAEVDAMLAPVRGTPYLVLHDSLQYFEHAFDVPAAGIVTVSPDRIPGARTLLASHAQIAAAGIECAFAEPWFPAWAAAAVTEGTSARLAAIDPVGARVNPGTEAYPAVVLGVAAAIRDCLLGGA